MGKFGVSKLWFLFLGVVLINGIADVQAWSKEGHVMTCKIAQDLLEPDAAHAVKMLLPDYVNGNLSALCVWPDQIRHWYRYRWTSPLHFIDTPDDACSFDYSRDCHDTHGGKDMCVAGAIKNFTSQLSHYHHGTSDRRNTVTLNLRELWNICGKAVTLMDVFIAKRRNKLGQMFAFCHYIKVSDSALLIGALNKTWIRKLHLHANVARFGRDEAVNPTPASV
ncbi:endonuclease 1 [Tanacetum coccineum]